MKILTIVGARPQFIKAAVLSRLFRRTPGCQEWIVHTGQHYDDNMSDVFFRELEIPAPAFHLGIGSGPHGQQTGRMLESIEKTLLDTRPDLLLIYGDTNSTLAGALAAAKLHVPIAHVEAGLRSFNRRMPEEINRVVADHLSSWLFAPTETAVRNLRQEGIPEDRIHLVGDVMFDAAQHAGTQPAEGLMQRHGLAPKGYVLATIHRAENTDDPKRLSAILHAFAALAATLPVVLPLHPRTRSVLKKHPDLEALAANLRLLDPVGYLEMVALEKSARLIATDSGGVQKEAFFQKTPCVTLRNETEWVELVHNGWNRLAPPEDPTSVVRILRGALEAPLPPDDPTLYGGGLAGQRIVDVLLRGR